MQTAVGTAIAGAVVSANEEFLTKIQEYSKNNPFLMVQGAFGDMEECDGLVEGPVIDPPEGGRFTKFWGCSYLFKGFPEKHIVEGLTMGKAMISIIPRKIIANSFILQVVLAFFLIFRRKKLIHYFRIYSYSIWNGVVEKSALPKERYNKFTKELRRSVNHALNFILEENNLLTSEPLLSHHVDAYSKKEKKREIWQIIAYFAEFVYLFLEFDNAYRLPLQDALSEVRKEAVKEDVYKETKRILDLLISRHDPKFGPQDKWIKIRKIFLLVLKLNKNARYFMTRFWLAYNPAVGGLDEHDWYFSLRRRAYNAKGISLEERLKEKARIDKEKGHTIFTIVPVEGKNERGEKVQGVKLEIK